MYQDFLKAGGVEEVRRAIDRLGDDGTRLTNFYANDGALDAWIKRGQLFIHGDARTLFLIRTRQGFKQLYFISTGTADLSEKLSTLCSQSNFIISTDLLGNIDEISPCFGNAGFMRYMTLTRMFRLKTVEAAVQPEASWFASPNEVDAVEEIIYENMDPLCEQIPDTEDIRDTVERHCVLAARHGSELATILYFDRLGVTATLASAKWSTIDIARSTRTPDD